MHTKKRCTLLFLVAFAAIAFSSLAAATTEEFNDKILSGDSIDIDDFTFIITMNKYASSIHVDAGTMWATVPLYGCGKMEHFRICFKNTTYDEEENDLFAEVAIYRYKPDITMTREINATELFTGEEAQVTITLKNSGDPAEQVILTDDYPSSVLIYDLEGGCQVHENQVYWKGHLDGNESRECRFIIKPLKEIHQTLASYLKYWDGFKWEEEYSTTFAFDVEPVLETLMSIVREDYEVDEINGETFDYEDDLPDVYIGEELRLVINITNNHPSENIYVDGFEITLPSDLEYKSTGYLRFNYLNASGNRSSRVWNSDPITKVSSNILRWKGYVNVNKSKAFIIRLKAKRTGSQNILTNTDYRYDYYDFKDDGQMSFNVLDPGVGIRMTISDESRIFSAPERLDQEDDTIDVEALHPYRVTVYAQNLNKYSKLSGVDVKVYTEIAGFRDVRYTEIEEQGRVIPYSLILIPPNSAYSTEYPMNISVSYTNDYGEKKYNSTEFRVNVKSAKDITIKLESSEGEVLDGGEETEMTVTVKNDRLVDIRDVRVEDFIPADLKPEGVHAKSVKLNKESETVTYKYRITPPVVHNKTYYNITTTVTFFDPDLKTTLNYTEVTELTINQLKPSLNLEVTLDEPTDVYPGVMIPVEYTISNDEVNEIVRDITVYFPIQQEFDLVGPTSVYIDKLDPGEKYTVKNLVKLRPKIVDDNLRINMTTASYYDNYGNIFEENSSSDSIEVQPALVTGPLIFITTKVPQVINKSNPGTITIEVMNNGSAAADVTVGAGDHIWNVSVPASSSRDVQYTVKYDEEGNYTLPEPNATFKIQGLDAHTKGYGANVTVKMLLGPAAEEEAAAEKKVEAAAEIEEEPEEMSFAEYEQIKNEEMVKRIIRYSIVGAIIIIVFVLIMFYIGYQRRRAPTAPIMETEE
ncbi:hypothetical protein KY363_01800 [Candidatus Woesearchaeota archaeon]|nr:hypothetical protein [Candidatus Woesearchaeota archaeon]